MFLKGRLIFFIQNKNRNYFFFYCVFYNFDFGVNCDLDIYGLLLWDSVCGSFRFKIFEIIWKVILTLWKRHYKGVLSTSWFVPAQNIQTKHTNNIWSAGAESYDTTQRWFTLTRLMLIIGPNWQQSRFHTSF